MLTSGLDEQLPQRQMQLPAMNAIETLVANTTSFTNITQTINRSNN